MPTAYGRTVRRKKLTDFLPTRNGYQPGRSANPGAPIRRPKARSIPKRGGGSRAHF